MLRSPWEWVLLSILLGGPLALRLRGGVRDRVFLLAWFHLLYGAGYVLLAPEGKPAAAAAAAIALLVVDLALRLAPSGLAAGLVRAVRSPRLMAGMAVLSLTILPLAAAEIACRVLTGAGVLRYHQPIETVWKSGHDDWRVATITADIHREPDPVLLWRPVASRPYNAQRFKGPLIQTPKPPGVLRVFCYGDSLTDGPGRGDWPSRLHRLLNENPPQQGQAVEVINAGVAGYSSHQGLLRFLQEVDRYRPDLILVGFGWNDVAQASGPPDREFRPPSAPVVAMQRAMIRYRAYLVLTAHLRALRPEPTAVVTSAHNPRVSVPDYVANLERFRAEAAARGIPIAFLTRPHRAKVDELERNPTWRSHVPEYNRALISWARSGDVPLIDAQSDFADQPESIFSDECHFVPDGYEQMAELVRDRLFMGPQPLFRTSGNSPALVRAEGGAGRTRHRPVERTASSREP